MKHCPRCGRDLSLAAFHRNKSRPDGLTGCCKECQKVRDKNRHEQQRDERLKYMREHNPVYYAANREKLRERNGQTIRERRAKEKAAATP